jgi:hypothetical protein
VCSEADTQHKTGLAEDVESVQWVERFVAVQLSLVQLVQPRAPKRSQHPGEVFEQFQDDSNCDEVNHQRRGFLGDPEHTVQVAMVALLLDLVYRSS